MLLNIILELNIINYIQSRFENQTSYEWRKQTWHILIQNFNWLSLLIGHGVGSSREYLLTIRPNDIPNPHNGYIELLYEYGIAGMIYIIGIASVAVTNLKKVLGIKDFKNKFIYLIPVLYSLTFLVELMFDVVVTLRETTFYLWTYIAIFCIMINIKEKNESLTLKI